MRKTRLESGNSMIHKDLQGDPRGQFRRDKLAKGVEGEILPLARKMKWHGSLLLGFVK
jgi:hypothetical protein